MNRPAAIPDEPSYRRIWQIARPVLLSVMVEQLVSLTDTAFLGRVGEVELGASALGGVFFLAMFVVCFGFAQGAQIIMARRNGEGSIPDASAPTPTDAEPAAGRGERAIGSVFFHSLAFLLVLSAAMFVLIPLGAPHVLRHLVSSSEVRDATATYLDWRAAGIIFSAVACLFRAFYVATTRTKVLTLNSVAMVSANILLDWLLIFGHCGLPAMGIAGAAIASTLANLVSMLFFIVYTHRRIDLPRYSLHRLPRWSGRQLRRILDLSVWTMVQDFISCGTWFLFFLAVEHLGTTELAVSNILRNVSAVCYMAVTALGVTAGTLAANMMGSCESLPADLLRSRMLRMLRKSVWLCTLVLAPLLLAIVLFPSATLRVFTSDRHLVEAGIVPLYVLVSSFAFSIPWQILFRAVSATGNTRTALLFELLSLAGYVAFILLFIVRLHASIAVCWLSEHTYYGISLVLCAFYMARGEWMKRKV